MKTACKHSQKTGDLYTASIFVVVNQITLFWLQNRKKILCSFLRNQLVNTWDLNYPSEHRF